MNGSSLIGIGNISNIQLYSFCYLKTFKIGLDSKIISFQWPKNISNGEQE